MSYCNECPNHDACDTGCVIGAARRIPTPSSEANPGIALPVSAVDVSAANGANFGWCLVDANKRVLAPYLSEKQARQMSVAINVEALDELPFARSETKPNLYPEMAKPSAIEPPDAYKDAVAMNLRLRKALEQCVLVCREWHAMPKKPGPEDCFDLYFNHSPEMQPIRDVLGKMPEPE